MTCLTCGALEDFREARSDSEASTRPTAFERLEQLGTSGDWTHACRCPDCDAVFEWYRDRDSDTGITSESILRRDGAQAVRVLIDGLEWPWPADDRPRLLAALRRRLSLPSVAELEAAEHLDRAQLVQVALLGPAAASLKDRLAPHAETELGARALAAIGAFDLLEPLARRGCRPAIRALARSGPPSCEAALTAVLTREEDPLARGEAAFGLGRLGLGRDALFTTLKAAGDTQIVNACRGALAAMGALDLLLSALASTSWSVQRAGAEGLGMAGQQTPTVTAALSGAVVEPGRTLIVRVTAFRALVELGTPRAQLEPLVEQLLADADPDARRAATRCRDELADPGPARA